MNLTFFLVIWTIVAVTWNRVGIQTPNKWYLKYIVVAVLAPVTVWSWFKIGFKLIKDRITGA